MKTQELWLQRCIDNKKAYGDTALRNAGRVVEQIAHSLHNFNTEVSRTSIELNSMEKNEWINKYISGAKDEQVFLLSY